MDADCRCTKRHGYIRKLTLYVSAFQRFPLIWQIFIFLFLFRPRYLHHIQPAHPYTFCCFFHKYIENKQWVMHNWKTNQDHVIKRKHFHVAGPQWGDSTDERWIPLTKANDAELWCFLWSAPEQKAEQTIETPLIWDAIALIMTSL